MKAFKTNFSSYTVAESQAAAQRDMDLIRAMCISRGVQPGVAIVTEVPDEELSRLPALRRLIDRKTKPAHGPAASSAERRDVIEAIARASHGDVGLAHAMVGGIESGCGGYLPRTIALRMLQKFSEQSTAVHAA